jgi:hypothetical protein
MIQGKRVDQIRKFQYLEMRMMRTLSMMLAVAGLLAAQEGVGNGCSLLSLKGTYGTILTGTKPSGPPPAPLEQMIGVALTTFDGRGHSTAIDNIHGLISGVTMDRPGTGTYTINEDCSGTAILLNAGAPPLGLRFVVLDNGKEFRGIVVSPASVMVTFLGRRI